MQRRSVDAWYAWWNISWWMHDVHEGGIKSSVWWDVDKRGAGEDYFWELELLLIAHSMPWWTLQPRPINFRYTDFVKRLQQRLCRLDFYKLNALLGPSYNLLKNSFGNWILWNALSIQHMKSYSQLQYRGSMLRGEESEVVLREHKMDGCNGQKESGRERDLFPLT